MASASKSKTAKSKKKTKKAQIAEKNYRYQITVFCLGVLSIFSFMAIYTDVLGPAGSLFRNLFGLFLGAGAYLFPLWFVGIAIFAIVKKDEKVRCIIAGITLLFVAALIEAVPNSQEFSDLAGSGMELSGGGILGGGLFILLRLALSRAGAVLLLIALIIAAALIVTKFSVKDFIQKTREQQKALKAEAQEEKAKEKSKKEEQSLPDFDEFMAQNHSKSKVRPLKPIFDIPIDQSEVGFAMDKCGERPEIDNMQAPPDELEYVSLDTEPSGNAPAAPEKNKEKTKTTEKSQEFEPNEAKPVKYITPPITLLTPHKGKGGMSEKDIRINSQKLVDVLQSFGVTAKVIGASKGPTVTRYEIIAASGTKVSKISGLSEDIALHMGVSGVRIAPVPERSAIGIEVPNDNSSIVPIRECVETPEFSKSPSKLAFALGKDISGRTIIADIAKMPHLLIAGSTGSGKSVCINTIILSIMYKASPEEVKLLMIDPKVVELRVYNGIPHLVSPVVTDPKKAANALNWAVSEMTRRYKVFADCGVRNIKGYNQLAARDDTLKHMEQIVIIIDELADLMMAAPNEVEDAIQRLAQLARAAGMHLVVATQRPSVNVITGVIKANIPSRIAFAVSSQIDSRTILDVSGAEKLLGKGDMLYHPTGAPKSTRVQGSFVSDEDVEQVVEFVKNNSSQVEYNEEAIEFIKKEPETKKSKAEPEDEEDIWDVRLPEAVEIVMQMGSASTSMLQRKMGVGYARAARMVDQLEQQGVVGPPDGSKPRELLMTRQQYLEMMSYNEHVQSSMDEIIEEAPDDGEIGD